MVATTAAALIGAVVGVVLIRWMSIEPWISERSGRLESLKPSITNSPPLEVAAVPGAGQTPESAAASETAPWRLSVMPRSGDAGTWETAVERRKPEPEEEVRASLEKPDRSLSKAKKKRSKRRWGVTLKARLAEIGPAATIRLAAKFEAAKAAWPPDEIAFVAIKDEKVLELYARSGGSKWQRIHRYRVLAASGGAGPKLQQGDRQVPEGLYRIVYLNPRSAYHVSLRVNYPNTFDRKMAAKDGRKKLGGDIMIHGKRSSAGCLAMGDPAAEELFVLAAKTGYSKIKMIIAPTDFRRHGVPSVGPEKPKWLPKLYSEISTAMAEYKLPPPRSTGGLLSFFSQ